jgi:hypothetical protein
MESDIPDGGTNSAVDLCQALDWTDIICTTRPGEIATRVTDEPTPHSKNKEWGREIQISQPLSRYIQISSMAWLFFRVYKVPYSFSDNERTFWFQSRSAGCYNWRKGCRKILWFQEAEKRRVTLHV